MIFSWHILATALFTLSLYYTIKLRSSLVAAAALFAYNQAQQGNDWRPIVTQIALAFGIVIALDVVTFLFIGNGTGTTARLMPSVPPLGIGTILTFLK
ncbi:MAG: hypothetical protein RLO19_22390 [Coleofasciculus sp. G2-EDA-02]